MKRQDVCRKGWFGAEFRGFTLIELMVVVAIIGVLAAILLPSLAKAKSKAIQTGCIANQKQIGLALQAYVDDHEDLLPGPIWATARANYDKNSSLELIYYLATYLESPAPSGKMVTPKVFVCPAYARWAKAGLSGLKVWLLNDDVDPNAGNKLFPFGYPIPPYLSSPMKVTGIDLHGGSPADTFALMDIDQLVPALPLIIPKPIWFDSIPTRPLHGVMRNQLFFDWHVESVKW